MGFVYYILLEKNFFVFDLFKWFLKNGEQLCYIENGLILGVVYFDGI